MKTASAQLRNLLESGREFVMADLIAIELLSGQVLRYTSADRPQHVDDAWWQPAVFSRGKTRVVAGIQVDELDVTFHPAASDVVGGIGWLAYVRNGGLDGATLKLYRLFGADWDTPPAGSLLLFAGRMADVELSRTAARLKVKSQLELLDVRLPRNLYQAGCLNALFDGGCGLSRLLYQQSGQVTGGDANAVETSVIQAAGWFELGVIRFDSGANAGASRSVRHYAGGRFELSHALPFLPQPGDLVSAWPGCDRSKDTCQNKFNNLIHFRGFPYIPVPETAV